MHFRMARNAVNRTTGGLFASRQVPATAVSLLMCIAFAAWNVPVNGADAAFNEAVRSFAGGKYSQALAQFQVVSQKYPSDPLTRYYMGLCYQQLNQVGQAQQMYTWVERNAHSNDLKAKARAGLDSMNQYSAARAHPGSAPPPPPAADKDKAGDAKAADAKGGATPAKTADAKGAMKCKKVIQFTSGSSNEQRQIQMFAPFWEEASTKFKGKVDFQIVDTDSGGDLVKKYGVTTLPFVVYLDKDGKLLSSTPGASGDISSTIEGFR